ncbi:MAG: orotate phosphoribosyltransferase [Candidatus Kerfeldbacteria bacterium]|jgi:uridine monophosphate synthetase
MSFDITQHLEFLKILREDNLIKVGTLTKLKDGSMSPIYVDLRDKMWAIPGLLNGFGKLFMDKILSLIPKDHSGRVLICGIPEAANPLGTATVMLAHESGWDWQLIALRHQPKAYGSGDSKTFVIGGYQPGDLVYLLDDVITTSDSKRDAIRRLEVSGFPPESIITLVAFDRQQGGLKSLSNDGYQTESLFPILKVADMFFNEGMISADELEDVKKFIADNQH